MVASRLDLDEVLPAAQLGEPWALRVLYDALSPQVLGYLRVRGAQEPEEATSEVFLTVFGALPTITGGAAGLRTFTFSVAHARLVDDLRRQQRKPPTAPYDPKRDARRTASAEDEADKRANTERVRALLALLPDDQRAVLSLRMVADLSVEETSQAIGKSPGAVKQLQRRALIALRGHLSDGE